jgi:FKBP-type peptidyl-prolyl cis-trans isomerase FkpA
MIYKNKIFRPVIASIILLTFIIVSCDPTSKYEKEELAQIQDYLTAHPDQDFELKASGLYYLDVIVGTGLQPVTHDTAYVIYTGKYLDGEAFGTNVDGDTLVYPVNEGALLPGFEEGVMNMREGGHSLLLVNSKLGYGNAGIYFPAFTPTLFEIELVQVVPGPGK